MARADEDHRVLVFAPIGRDGPASAELLRSADIHAVTCPDLDALISELDAGTGTMFLAEEGLFGKDTTPLVDWIEGQPAWSDLPIIVLTSHKEHPAVLAWRRDLVSALRNVSLLERPVQPITLTSAVRSALRARRRQYEVRALLRAREQAALQLESLVEERTHALEQANKKLRVEIEERARIEDTLRQAQKIEAVGQLTGGTAHDFNNLLMVISGGLEMLDRQPNAARRSRLMDGMLQAAQRGARLTRQLLAFSRRQELKPESVNIAGQIGGMRELLDRSLGDEVSVKFELPRGLWPVDVDPSELELVVLNLTVNARDAMPRGGTIIVRGENVPGVHDDDLAGDYVRLSVIDTGTGMSPEVQAHVFEPYFTTKDVGKGSGLGLAQVYGFAKQSRGTVRISSDVGQGTCVAIYLPKSDQVPADDPHHLNEPLLAAGEGQNVGCVLLVEDDNEVAALVSEMLDQLGYEVTRAASAAAALGALANGRRVDIVFSDIMMPGGMNGVELVREIRNRHGALPVVLTSGYAHAVAQEASEEGIRILAKPYRIDELSAALVEAAAQRMPLESSASPKS